MGTSSALDSQQQPTRKRYVVMAFLCVLSFLTYFDRACIVRAQEDIKGDLGLSFEQMGVIMGAFWFAYALFEIPGGWLGDRYGARITLTRIVFAWSLFTVLSGAATGFYTLLTYRLLFGAGEAGAYPNMARVQSRWLPIASRARAGGLLWLLARWGAAFSPLLFGEMLRGFGSPGFRSVLAACRLPDDIAAWRLAFMAAGLVGAVWCVSFYWWFRDDPAQVPSVNAAELRLIQGDGPTEPEKKHHMPADAWRALFQSRSLWAMGILYILGSFGWSFFLSWMPEYMKQIHGVSFEKSELQTGLPLFCGGVSCLVGGTLSDLLVRRTGRKYLGRALFPMTGYTTAAIAMFGVQYTTSPDQATLLMCIAGAAFDFGQGANWATVVDIGGIYAGATMGFINMIGNAGNYAQPYIGAKIFAAHGWNALMAVYSAAFLGAALMWLFINPNHTFYETEGKST
jgi:MFS family permease